MSDKVKNLMTSSAILLSLVACSTNVPHVAPKGAAAPVALSDEQMQIVESGVKEMMAGKKSSAPRRPRAMTISGSPGIHVCGSVDSGDEEIAFYIELRDKDGKPYAERGQVASDAAKKAKIAFVCRHHQV